MNTFKLSNISKKEFETFLESLGCVCTINNGHAHWHKEGLTRPITIQTHIDPIPEFIVKNCLRNLGITRKEFESMYFKKE